MIVSEVHLRALRDRQVVYVGEQPADDGLRPDEDDGRREDELGVGVDDVADGRHRVPHLRGHVLDVGPLPRQQVQPAAAVAPKSVDRQPPVRRHHLEEGVVQDVHRVQLERVDGGVVAGERCREHRGPPHVVDDQAAPVVLVGGTGGRVDELASRQAAARRVVDGAGGGVTHRLIRVFRAADAAERLVESGEVALPDDLDRDATPRPAVPRPAAPSALHAHVAVPGEVHGGDGDAAAAAPTPVAPRGVGAPRYDLAVEVKGAADLQLDDPATPPPAGTPAPAARIVGAHV